MNKLVIDLASKSAAEVVMAPEDLASLAGSASVPSTVTMRQLRLQLLQLGKLSNVDAAIAMIPDETSRQAALIEWEYASVVERDKPLTLAIAQAIGMSSEELDQAFRDAAIL